MSQEQESKEPEKILNVKSPLGEDPEPVEETPAKEEAKIETPKKTRTISEDEWNEFQRKSGIHDTIVNDPELSGMISDHYKAKRGKLTKADSKPDKEETEGPTELDKLREEVKTMQKRAAMNEVQIFIDKNPDVKDYATDMKHLMDNYGMSIADAYKYAKATKAQTSAPEKKLPPQPTTEVESGDLEESSDEFTGALKRINDSKATPQMDDAFDLAYKTAKRMAK